MLTLCLEKMPVNLCMLSSLSSAISSRSEDKGGYLLRSLSSLKYLFEDEKKEAKRLKLSFIYVYSQKYKGN